MPDPGSADGLSWIPACPPTIADEAALDRVAARVAGHSLHQFDPMFQKGTAVLMDLTYGFEFGRARPINRPRSINYYSTLSLSFNHAHKAVRCFSPWLCRLA